MDYLHDDIIWTLTIKLPIRDLKKLFQASKRYNSISLNPHFWKSKYKHDYGDSNFKNNWKFYYMNYGRVFMFKHNKYYELSCRQISSVVLGRSHALLINIHHELLGLGNNNHGQLGSLSDIKRISEPRQLFSGKFKLATVTDQSSLVIDTEDQLHIYGSCSSLNNMLVKSVSASNLGIVFINLENDVYLMHRDGPLLRIFNGAKSVTLGNRHIGIVDFDNNLWVMGENSNGQLGLGDYIYRDMPVKSKLKVTQVVCSYDHTAIIDLDNRLFIFGTNIYGTLDRTSYNTPVFISHNAKYVSTCESHTMFIDLDNNLWGLGNNESGQLGIDGLSQIYAPLKVKNFKATTVSTAIGQTMIIGMPFFEKD